MFEITNRKSLKKHCGPACRARAKYWRDKPRNVPHGPQKPTLVYVDNCPTCHEPMYSSRPHQKKYCSPACRQSAYRARKEQNALSAQTN